MDPPIVACSFIASGLRVFDIRDPLHPVEVGYFNKPDSGGGFAMSAPAFAPEREEVWYSDGNNGFFALRLQGPARIAGSGAAEAVPPAAPSAAPAAGPTPGAPGPGLPATGLPSALGWLSVLLMLSAGRALPVRRP